jgi:biopolymer transport protein ExbB
MTGNIRKYLTPVTVVFGILIMVMVLGQMKLITKNARAAEIPTPSRIESTTSKAGAAAKDESASQPTLWQVLKTGGVVMLILFIFSIITIALIIYYALALTTGNVMPEGFTDRVEEILGKHRFDEASMFCRQNQNPLARIIETGIGAVPRGHEVIQESVNGEGARQASSLWQKISYLNDIAIIAPMLGLLGTVVGMLDSFLAITYRGGTTVGTVNPASLASGVATALITTVAGLIVGIIATIAYAYFRGVVQRIVIAMEARGSQFADIIEQGAKKQS